MTGDAHPFAVRINPRVRESPIMIEGLTFVKPFGVIGSSNHGRVSIYEDLLVTICHKGGGVGQVSIVSQELGLRRESTVIVRADKAIRHQLLQRLRIVMQLGLVPAILQGNQWTLVPVCGHSGTLSA